MSVPFPLLNTDLVDFFDLRILEPIASMFKMSCIISNRLQETKGLLLHFEWTDTLLPGVIQSMVAIAATWMISKLQGIEAVKIQKHFQNPRSEYKK